MSPLTKICFAAVTLLVLGSGFALLRAQEAGDTSTAEPAPSGGREMYPADLGALQYTDLVEGPVPAPTEEEIAAGHMSEERYRATSAETRATADDVEAWAQVNNGPAAQQAWSGYSAAMAAQAETRAAESIAGTSALGEAGVLP